MPASLYNPNLELFQIGQEATWAAAGDTTIELAGITSCKITPKIECSQVMDKRGSAIPGYTAVVNRIGAEVDVSGLVAYNTFNYWLDTMFKLDALPSAYKASVIPEVPSTMLIKYGQPGLMYEVAGCVMDKLVIKGDTNGPLTFDAHLAGKAPIAHAETALTATVPTYVMGGQVAWSMGLFATARAGLTALTLTGYSFELTMQNSRHVTYHMGTLNPDNFAPGQWGGGLHMVAEMTAATQAYLTAILAATAEPIGYNVRFVATGPAANVMTMDFSGHLLAAPIMFTDQDGVTTAEMDLSPAYNVLDDTCFQFAMAIE